VIDKAQLVKLPPEPPPKPTLVEPLLKLDLGCGQNKRAGFQGVDYVAAEGVDVVHDLSHYPWPFATDSVDEIHCSHFFEHVPGPERGVFMDEVYRVLKVGCFATFITPYWACVRAVQDFTHAWPPISAESYYYFQRAWREANKLTHGHYDLKCNFDPIDFPGQALDGMWAQRAPEALAFAAKHYVNVIHDLTARLTKKVA